MKKELFNLLVERLLAKPELFSTHKVTKKDGLEVHTFGSKTNTDLAEAKALFKEKGYKMEDVDTEAQLLKYRGKLSNTYLTLLYGEDKDKISISTFESGYAQAFNKRRYYPLKKNYPVFAYTSKMYGFKRVRKGAVGVRIQCGNIYVPGWDSGLTSILTKTLYNVDYIPQARISYRHLINTKSDLQGIGNMFGVRVPDALKIFSAEEVLCLYKTIKDFNQINKLCQFIAKEGAEHEDLYECIAEMLFGNFDKSWLVRDYIGDCLSLKTRDISFSVTSEKRWRDEHQKAATKRMLKGMPEIKVHEEYKNALNGCEYPYELIEKKDRLMQESQELHHCVGTYASKINDGRCAIFSVTYGDQRYTLEVSARKVKEGVVFTPVQFRGLSNAPAPDEIGQHVAKILHMNSSEEAYGVEVIPETRELGIYEL